jgi:phosphoglycolate phosphatase
VAVQRAIGFDLDMTLVDSRPGIHAALLALAAETGRPVDADEIVAHLGPPIAEALAPYFPADELAATVDTFRALMALVGVMNVRPLPGAAAAVAAARQAGYNVLVVTSKIRPLAVATLQHAGLEADAVHGDAFGVGKAVPLREHHATAYVGDHPADMLAAAEAGVAAVGVTSGSSTADDLTGAGADVVLASLDDFPDWLRAHS